MVKISQNYCQQFYVFSDDGEIHLFILEFMSASFVVVVVVVVFQFS